MNKSKLASPNNPVIDILKKCGIRKLNFLSMLIGKMSKSNPENFLPEDNIGVI